MIHWRLIGFFSCGRAICGLDGLVRAHHIISEKRCMKDDKELFVTLCHRFSLFVTVCHSLSSFKGYPTKECPFVAEG
jgi:hypothetical protein